MIEFAHEIVVKEATVELVEAFVAKLGNAGIKFRYFNKRSSDVILAHLCTFLFLHNSVPIAYGHLDEENDIIWLGLSVLPPYQRKGLGSKMLDLLIDRAKDLKIEKIKLSVDNDNFTAIALYEKKGFKREQTKEELSFYSYFVEKA